MTALEAIEILKTDMGCYECTFGCSTTYECANGGCPFREAIRLAAERLSIDIVFCHECKFENTRKCPPHRMGLIHDASDYCSYGIRKTDIIQTERSE